MRPRVIHIIETAEPGGAENILVQIANGLRDDFDPVGVVLAEGWTSAALRGLQIPVIHLPLRRSFDIGWVWQMIRVIRRENISLIHAHEFTANCYALLAAKLAGIPIICTVHGKNYYPDRYYRRFAYRRVARFADAFIAVSNDLRQFVASRIGIAPERIRMIHNGIDTRVFAAHGAMRSRVRAALDIPAGDIVMIVVSALFEMKGIQDLIDAIGQLRTDRSRLHLLLVGDGNYRATLEQRVNASGLTGMVRFLGFRSDVPDLLAAADLFVLPSYSEGLPVSLLEAMATGLVAITTDVGGLKEVIVNGENGWLVAPAAPAVLAAAIDNCVENPQETMQLRQRARQDVVSGFDIRPMLTNYRELYLRLLTGITDGT